MKPPGFPFPALVGLEPLKLALQLAAIDVRLSVLIRGDKGAGKSTAARGLVDLLEPGAPFVNLPIGATEDRLLGGLDVEKALKGEPALKRGLLADANGGVLYVDEVNLLPDHLADALLDAVASGVHIVEREGFSAAQAAQFVMIGSMNPEEGALRPQLLDRFALAVDVAAPMEPAIRREVMARRLAFDADAPAFADRWRMSRRRWRGSSPTRAIGLARVTLPAAMLDLIADTHRRRTASGRCVPISPWFVPAARSRRWKMRRASTRRTSRRCCRWRSRIVRTGRSRSRGRDRRRRRTPAVRGARARPDLRRPIGSLRRLIMPAPRLVVEQRLAQDGRFVPLGRRRARCGDRGPADRGSARARSSRDAGACGEPRSDDCARCRRPARAEARPLAGTRYVFVVDSSGSHAVQERMRLVKGAVNGLLEAGHGRHDEIVVIACRGGAGNRAGRADAGSGGRRSGRSSTCRPAGGRRSRTRSSSRRPMSPTRPSS